MKDLNKNVCDVITKIINNVNNDLIFCGSISDYYNFIGNEIDISDKISDVDIYCHNEGLITELENIFNCKAKLLELPNEKVITIIGKFNTKHYFIPINNTHIDIFLADKNVFESIQINENVFDDKKIVTVDKFDRNIQLNSTINFWYNTAPMTKRLLKYLKKRMIYNKILEDET